MKKFLSLLSITVCVFLASCGYKSKHIPAIHDDTPTSLRVPTSISTASPTEAPKPVSTVSLYFPPYPTKKIIFNYCVLGWHGNFDIFTDDQCHPLLVLYEDGQMIVSGKVHQQLVLSELEISEFLAQLGSRGLYTLETNQSHDPTDKLYDFGSHYKRIYDGLYYCVLVRNMGRERDLCAYDQQRQYLIPAMKDLLKFLGSLVFDGVATSWGRIWQKREEHNARITTQQTAQPAKSGSGQI